MIDKDKLIHMKTTKLDSPQAEPDLDAALEPMKRPDEPLDYESIWDQIQSPSFDPPGYEPEGMMMRPRARRPVRIVHGRGRTTARTADASKSNRRLIGRITGCVLVIAALVLSQYAPWKEAINEGIRTALTMDLQLDKRLGELQFVQEYFPRLVEVFAPSSNVKMVMPAVGKLVKGFEANEKKGILIEVETPGTVVASLDGQVVERKDEENGKILRIQHENGVETVYHGLLMALKNEGDAVKAGESLGTLRRNDGIYQLRFEVYKAGTAQDPAAYLPAFTQ